MKQLIKKDMQGINTLIGLLCVNLFPYSQMILDPMILDPVSVVQSFSEVGAELFKTFVAAPP